VRTHGIALLVLLPAALWAQKRDSTCTPPHTPDSLTVIVTAQLNAFDPKRPIPDSYRGLLLQEIATRLRVPQPFVLSTYVIPDSIDGAKNEPQRAYAGLYAMLAISIDNSSIAAKLAVSSAVPAFDKALIDAVNAIAAVGAVPSLPESARGKKLELRLRIGTVQHVDSGEALFRVRVPLARLSSDPMPKPGTRGPRYPEELRQVNMEGSVLVQFVVDEEGLALAGSIRVIRATHLLFAESVLEFIKKMRLHPARIGGCAVAVVVAQPVNFTLRR
jgi:TonB family protein